jgi:hypothetical protein
MLERPSKNCVNTIRNGDVKKNLWVGVGLKFLVLMSSPKSVVGDPEPKGMDSRQQSAGMTKGASLVLTPEFHRRACPEFMEGSKGCVFVSRQRKNRK